MKNGLFIIEIDNNLLFWIENNKNKNKNKGINYKQQKILKKIDHYEGLLFNKNKNNLSLTPP